MHLLVSICSFYIYNYIHLCSLTKSQGNLFGHEVERILNSNVEKIKNLLFCFMDSIFSNLYNMPVGIRIICKMIKTLAIKKVLFTLKLKYIKFIFLYRIQIWLHGKLTL